MWSLLPGLLVLPVAVAAQPPLSNAELRHLADARVSELGYSVAAFEITVLRELRPADLAFLAQQSIAEPDRLSAVYYDPTTTQLPPGSSQFGGDITVYIDPSTGDVVALWLGE